MTDGRCDPRHRKKRSMVAWMVWSCSHYADRPPLRPRRFVARHGPREPTPVTYSHNLFPMIFCYPVGFEHTVPSTFELRWSMKQLSGNSDSPWSKRRSKTNKSIAKKQLQLAANKNILAKSATISAWFHPASKIVFPLNINELRFSRRRNWVVLWKFLPKTVSRLWTLCEV